MTATLDDVTARKKKTDASAEQQAAAELARLTRKQGLSLTGPDGLLKQLTKTVLETALNEEMTEDLGYAKNDPAGAGADNIRNGSRPGTVLTEASGPVQIDVRRDRGQRVPTTDRPQAATAPVWCGRDRAFVVRQGSNNQRDLRAPRRDLRRLGVKDTISRITDKVIEEMTEWSHRPPNEIYAAVFIDAIVVKVGNGQVANRPFYAGAARRSMVSES